MKSKQKADADFSFSFVDRRVTRLFAKSKGENGLFFCLENGTNARGGHLVLPPTVDSPLIFGGLVSAPPPIKCNNPATSTFLDRHAN